MLEHQADKVIGHDGRCHSSDLRQESESGDIQGVDERMQEEADEVTGASPGTAQACSDLGLNSLEQNLARLGIKPPGVS